MVILFIVLINLVNGQNPDSVCYKCENGYSYNSEAKKCVQCQTSHCSGCETNGEGKCDEGKCAENCYLDKVATDNSKNTCKVCSDAITGCNTCSDAKTCTQCAVGTYRVAGTNGAADSCTTCPTTGDYVTCSACTSDTVCTKCGEGKQLDGFYYTLIEGKCKKCPEGCTECGADGKCKTDKCVKGRYFSEGSCPQCPSGTGYETCGACSSATVCTECGTDSDGYHYSVKDGNCIKCIEHCDACSDTVTCKVGTEEKCATGYSLVEQRDNNGILTSASCVKCQTANGQASGTSICTKCSVNGEQKCDSTDNCAEGYYLFTTADTNDATANTCKSCAITEGSNVVNAGCKKCTTAGTCNENQCRTGTYRDAQSVCQSCPNTEPYETCSACNSATECTQCATDKFNGRYYSLVEGKCVKCPEGCKACDKNGKCLADKCEEKRYFSEGSCPQCPSGTGYETCSACSDATHCTKCGTLSGYHYSVKDGKCIQCIAGCLECEDTQTCKSDKCNPDHFGYNSTTKICDVCNSQNNDLSCALCTKEPTPEPPKDDSSVMVSIVLGLIALIALF